MRHVLYGGKMTQLDKELSRLEAKIDQAERRNRNRFRLRFSAFLLCACVALGLVLSGTLNRNTFSAAPQPPGQVETINNETDFISFAQTVRAGAHREGVTVRLARDMNLTGVNWIPIGRPGAPFRGTFDPHPFVIRNLYLGSTQQLGTPADELNYQGLFGATDGATIRNVRVETMQIAVQGMSGLRGTDGTGGAAGGHGTAGQVMTAGGLVARATNTVIENSQIAGTIVAIGGAGGNGGQTTQTGTTNRTGTNGGAGGQVIVGGLVGIGSNGTTVRRSTMVGDIYGRGGQGGAGNTAQRAAHGGIGGAGGHSIVGGIIGRLTGTNNIIEETYSSATITAINGRGGNGGTGGNNATSNQGGAPGQAGTNIAGGIVAQVGTGIVTDVELALHSAEVRHSFFTGDLTQFGRRNGLRGAGRQIGTGDLGTVAPSFGGATTHTAGAIIGVVQGNGVLVTNSYAGGTVRHEHEFTVIGATDLFNVRMAGMAGFVYGTGFRAMNSVSLTAFDFVGVNSAIAPEFGTISSLTTNPIAIFGNLLNRMAAEDVSRGNQFLSLENNSTAGQERRFPRFNPIPYTFRLDLTHVDISMAVANPVFGFAPNFNWNIMTGATITTPSTIWLAGMAPPNNVPQGQNEWRPPEGTLPTGLPVLINNPWRVHPTNMVLNIATLSELVSFRNAVNAGRNFFGYTVRLSADINMVSHANWTPIGNNMAAPFRGTFDGQNNILRNLRINVNNAAVTNATAGSQAGVFGHVHGATIRNLMVEDPNVNVLARNNLQRPVNIPAGNMNQNIVSGVHNPAVGGVVGFSAHNLTMENVHVYGTPTFAGETFQIRSRTQGVNVASQVVITNPNANVGGLVGIAEGFNNVIRTSSNGIPVRGESQGRTHGSIVGGIVGMARDILIEENATMAEVTSEVNNQADTAGPRGGGHHVGGVIGHASGRVHVRNNMVTSDVVAYSHAGGIAGSLADWSRFSIFENNLFSGDIWLVATNGNNASNVPQLLVGGIVGASSTMDLRIHRNVVGSTMVRGSNLAWGGTSSVRMNTVSYLVNFVGDAVRRQSLTTQSWRESVDSVANIVNQDMTIGPSTASTVAGAHVLNNWRGIANAHIRFDIQGINSRPEIAAPPVPSIFSIETFGIQGVNWDLANVWYFEPGRFPVLQWMRDENLGPPVEGQPGDQHNPILINNVNDLIGLRNRVNDGTQNFDGLHIRMTADINLGGMHWVPIGNQSVAPARDFRGNFDGGGFTIRGLVNTADTNYRALFGRTTGATIRNLTIEEPNIVQRTGASVGAFIGHAVSTTLDNVHVVGGVIRSNVNATVNQGNNVGGIVGRLGAGSILRNSSVTGGTDIRGETAVGGIVGFAEGTAANTSILLENNWTTAHVMGINAVGGIAGVARGTTIQNSWNTGSVAAAQFGAATIANSLGVAGGIVGQADTQASLIVDVASMGNVTSFIDATNAAAGAAGGIIGRNAINGTVINQVIVSGAIRSHNNNTGAAAWTSAGGIIGRSDAASGATVRIEGTAVLSESISSYTISATANIRSTAVFGSGNATVATRPTGENNRYRGGTGALWNVRDGMTPTQLFETDELGVASPLTTVAHYSAVGFLVTPILAGGGGTATWNLGMAGAAADLQINNGMPFLRTLPRPIFEHGTRFNPHQINAIDELRDLAVAVNAGNRFLGQYLEIRSNIAVGEWSNPIGRTMATSFGGNLDGRNHRLTGLSTPFNHQFGVYGLFGYVAGATISNITMRDVAINVTGTNPATGSEVGALIGHADGGVRVHNVAVQNGTVQSRGNYTGGLVGRIRAGNNRITASYTTVTVAGGVDVGGLVGQMAGTVVDRAFATGNVNGTSVLNAGAMTGVTGRTGGLVGHIVTRPSHITNSFASGNVTDTRSMVNALSIAGGLIGVSSPAGTTISQVYASGNVSANTIGTGAANNLGQGSYAAGLIGQFAGTTATTILEHAAAFNNSISASTMNAGTPVNMTRLAAPIALTNQAEATRPTVRHIQFFSGVTLTDNNPVAGIQATNGLALPLQITAAQITDLAAWAEAIANATTPVRVVNAVGITPVANRNAFFPSGTDVVGEDTRFASSLFVGSSPALGFNPAIWNSRRSINNGSPYLRNMVVDVTSLVQLSNVERGRWYVPQNWTATTFAAFQDALNYADTVLADLNATIDDIDRAYTGILTSVRNLRGDRTGLARMVRFVQEVYIDWARDFLINSPAHPHFTAEAGGGTWPPTRVDIEMFLHTVYLNWGQVQVAFNHASYVLEDNSNRFSNPQITSALNQLDLAVRPQNMWVNTSTIQSLLVVANQLGEVRAEFNTATWERMATARTRARNAVTTESLDLTWEGSGHQISTGREVVLAAVQLDFALRNMQFDFVHSGMNAAIMRAENVLSVRGAGHNAFPFTIQTGPVSFLDTSWLLQNAFAAANDFRAESGFQNDDMYVDASLVFQKRVLLDSLNMAFNGIEFNRTGLGDIVATVASRSIMDAGVVTALAQARAVLSQPFVIDATGLSVITFYDRYHEVIENLNVALLRHLWALRNEATSEIDRGDAPQGLINARNAAEAALDGIVVLTGDEFTLVNAGAPVFLSDFVRNNVLAAIAGIRNNMFTRSMMLDRIAYAELLLNFNPGVFDDYADAVYFTGGVNELIIAVADARGFLETAAANNADEMRDAIAALEYAIDALVINIDRFQTVYYARAIEIFNWGLFDHNTRELMTQIIIQSQSGPAPASGYTLAHTTQATLDAMTNREMRANFRREFIVQIENFARAYGTRIYDRRLLSEEIELVTTYIEHRHDNAQFRRGTDIRPVMIENPEYPTTGPEFIPTGAFVDYVTGQPVNAAGFFIRPDGSLREFIMYTQGAATGDGSNNTWGALLAQLNAAWIVYFDTRPTNNAAAIDASRDALRNIRQNQAVSTTRIREVLAVAQGMLENSEFYTTASLAGLKIAVETVEDALADAEFVADMLADMNDAELRIIDVWQLIFDELIEAIANVEVDTQALRDLIATAQLLLPYADRYDEQSWNQFASTLAHVSSEFSAMEYDRINNGIDLDPHAVTTLFTMLRNAVNGLRADVGGLLTQYLFARGLHPTHMTAASFEALDVAARAARAVIDNRESEVEDVTTALANLEIALDEIVTDRAQLRLVIVNATTQLTRLFTYVSIANLEDAIALAEDVYESVEGGAEGVQALMAAERGIINAMAALVPNRAVLESLLFQIDQHLGEMFEGVLFDRAPARTFYIPATLNALDAIVAEAQGIVARTSPVTIDELTRAVNDLTEARANLRVDTSLLGALLNEAIWFEANMHLFVQFDASFWTLQEDAMNMIAGNPEPTITEFIEMYEEFRYFLVNLVFDHSALQFLIDEAEYILENRAENYSGRSITTLQYWLGRAHSVAGDPTDVLNGLGNAIASLVDITDLRDALRAAEDFTIYHAAALANNTLPYTRATFNRLVAAVADTRAELSDGLLLPATVSRLMTELNWSAYIIDLRPLRNALADAQTQLDGPLVFTSDSLAALNSAMSHGQTVVNNADAGTGAIAAAAQGIRNAITGLEEVSDEYLLEIFVFDHTPHVQGRYTEFTFRRYANALELANRMVDGSYLGPTTAGQVLAELSSAISALVYIGDLLDLATAYQLFFEQLVETDFTPASFANLRNTLQSAHMLLADALDLGQSQDIAAGEVSAMYDALRAARRDLTTADGGNEPTQLARPTSIAFADGILTWSSTGEATEYHVRIYGIPGVTGYRLVVATTNSLNLSTLLPALPYGVFTVVIVAIGDGVDFLDSYDSDDFPLVILDETADPLDNLQTFLDNHTTRSNLRYTAYSFAAYAAALDAAWEIANGDSGADPTLALSTLIAAIGNLVYFGDLLDLVAEYEAYFAELSQDDFTPSSWATFYGALNNARARVTDAQTSGEGLTRSTIQGAYSDLRTARVGLDSGNLLPTTPLPRPTNVQFANGILSWTSNGDAVGYLIRIYDLPGVVGYEPITWHVPSINLGQFFAMMDIGPGTYRIVIVALGDMINFHNSPGSDVFNLTITAGDIDDGFVPGTYLYRLVNLIEDFFDNVNPSNYTAHSFWAVMTVMFAAEDMINEFLSIGTPITEQQASDMYNAFRAAVDELVVINDLVQLVAMLAGRDLSAYTDASVAIFNAQMSAANAMILSGQNSAIQIAREDILAQIDDLTAASNGLIVDDTNGGGNDNLPRIGAPTNVRIVNGVLSWNAVDGAAGYLITINGELRPVQTTLTLNLTTLNLPVGTHTIIIVALGNSTTHTNSLPIAIQYRIDVEGETGTGGEPSQPGVTDPSAPGGPGAPGTGAGTTGGTDGGVSDWMIYAGIGLLAVLLIVAVAWVVLGRKKGKGIAALRASAKEAITEAFAALNNAKTQMQLSKMNPQDATQRSMAMDAMQKAKTAITTASEMVGEVTALNAK